MLIIYWLAVVFHLSLAGQSPVRHKVKTTTTTTTTRQSWPSGMPPMDPAARLYTKNNDGEYLEAYVVLDNKKTWFEAQKHCKHYNLNLALIDPENNPLVREKIKQLTGRMPDLNGVLWRHQYYQYPNGECITTPEMGPPHDKCRWRNCYQTGKDKNGYILLGYVCGRVLTEKAYRAALTILSKGHEIPPHLIGLFL